ncbi:unnamed protein product [Caenorhabditis sp. 36 PRJEB53466]|nr:unnamed protein product [Caenorhabditis sp. 36 PRJEB53466]
MAATVLSEFADFNEYSNATRDRLVAVLNFIEKAVQTLGTWEFGLAVIGSVLNVFHLIILTRKPMRSSSTNVLMIGIGACDLFIMVFCGYAELEELVNPDYECWTPSSYLKLVLDLWASALKDDLRRLSAWLGVLMATVRFLIVKNSLNPRWDRLSQPPFGWKLILISLVFSSFISMFYWARLEIIEIDPWIPAQHCSNFPANYTEQQFGLINNDLFLKNDLLALQIFLFTDGTLKIIPAAVFPILTFLLIRELKSAEVSRRKISVAQKGDSAKKDHTTNLVILMTVTFMIAEGPLGMIYVFQGFLTTKPGFLAITTGITDLLNIFVAINATTHCVICLTMSSQYRNCVRRTFCCVKEQKKTVTVSPKVSVGSAASLKNVVISVACVANHPKT